MPEAYTNIISKLINMRSYKQVPCGSISFHDFVQYVNKITNIHQVFASYCFKVRNGLNQNNLSLEAQRLLNFLNLDNINSNNGILKLYIVYLIQQNDDADEDIHLHHHLEALAVDPLMKNSLSLFYKACELESEIRLLLENKSLEIEPQANFLLKSQDEFETVIKNIAIIVSLAKEHCGLVVNEISSYLKHILEQLKQSIKHVQVDVEGYVSYGVGPCIELLQEANQFITPLLHPIPTPSIPNTNEFSVFSCQ